MPPSDVSIRSINLHTQNVQFWFRFDEKLAEKAQHTGAYVSILRTIFRQIWTKSGRSHLQGEWLPSDFVRINREYQYGRLLAVDADPFVQFNLWFREASQQLPDHLVNGMTLATVSADNQPSARIVLLKEYTPEGFIFHTNYESRKGVEIAQNPAVSLLFWWEPLERQIRIEGVAEKISAQRSTDYFRSRPKSSQIAALASQQSRPLPSVEYLDDIYQRLCAEYAGAETIVSRPDYWGGYLIKPDRFEFWQGRPSRLHDRFSYVRVSPSGAWQVERLFP
jgi:pyridoxamine 5'-phosphate oxidase